MNIQRSVKGVPSVPFPSSFQTNSFHLHIFTTITTITTITIITIAIVLSPQIVLIIQDGSPKIYPTATPFPLFQQQLLFTHLFSIQGILDLKFCFIENSVAKGSSYQSMAR